MRGLAPVVGISSVFVAPGCDPSLGECEITTARMVVYDTCGTPGYAGQALMRQSCGFGNYCHAENATGSNRYGAPAGLNWDVNLVGAETTDADLLARL